MIAPAAVGCMPSRAARSHSRIATSTRVPERQHLDRPRWTIDNSVIQVVLDAAQEHPPNAWEFDGLCRGSDFRLQGEEVERLFELLAQRVWCQWTVFPPPLGGRFGLRRGPAREINGKGRGHSPSPKPVQHDCRRDEVATVSLGKGGEEFGLGGGVERERLISLASQHGDARPFWKGIPVDHDLALNDQARSHHHVAILTPFRFGLYLVRPTEFGRNGPFPEAATVTAQDTASPACHCPHCARPWPPEQASRTQHLRAARAARAQQLAPVRFWAPGGI